MAAARIAVVGLWLTRIDARAGLLAPVAVCSRVRAELERACFWLVPYRTLATEFALSQARP